METILTTIGLASIIAILLQIYFNNRFKMRELWLKEYLLACDGFLDSLKDVKTSEENNDEESRIKSLKKFAYFELKIQLYASSELIHEIKDFKKNSHNTEKVIKKMRQDLESKMKSKF